MRQPISTFNINWEGKTPGYYVRRVSRDGYITGHLTANGGWSSAYRARAFNSQAEAIAAANRTGARRFDVLVNRFQPVKLDTTRYANGIVARNALTGLYWNGKAFAGETNEDARLLSAAQVAVLRCTYQNVVTEQVVTLLDEICATLNATGRVGYFFNAMMGDNMRNCELKIDADRAVYCTWRKDGNIEMHLIDPRQPNTQVAFAVVQNFAQMPEVLIDWSTDERRAAILKGGAQ